MSEQRFDAAYFQRYYFSAATRVAEPDYFARLGRFVAAYLDMLGCRVERVLDAGCGPGLMHVGLREAWPGVSITGVDASAHACAEYGWEHARLQDFDTDQSYDLVICHDVVQYLGHREAAAVMAKLARWTHCALFFGVLTREDWEQNCDQTLTDGDVFRRRASWYRRHLRDTFRNAGGGLYIRRDADVVLYALEAS